MPTLRIALAVRRLLTLAVIVLALLPGSSALAQEAAPKPTKRLVVGTHEIAPFVIKNADGSWSGISIDIWKRVADEMGLEYTIKDVPIAELLEPETSGLDVIVSVSITLRNEKSMDVAHAFYSTGLGIATRTEPKSGVTTIISKIVSAKVAKGIGALLLILLITGVVVWLAERGKRPEEFGGPPLRGIGAGVFWAFEFIVGKGGALSKTFGHRILALAWTGTCVMLVSGVTASLSSELTVNKLSSTITGPNDLPKVKVGSVKRPSQSARYLDARSIPFREYENVEQAVSGLAAGDVDAVLFEAPILQHYVRKAPPGQVVMLPGTFQNHGYGFGFKPGSPMRESVSRLVLKMTEEDQLRPIFARYLGSAD